MVQNFVADDFNHIKTLSTGHGVHNHIRVNADKMFAVEDAVLVLACGIYYLCSVVYPSITYDFGERVFDSWIVAFDKMPVDKLHGQRCLA